MEIHTTWYGKWMCRGYKKPNQPKNKEKIKKLGRWKEYYVREYLMSFYLKVRLIVLLSNRMASGIHAQYCEKWLCKKYKFSTYSGSFYWKNVEMTEEIL